MRLRLIAIEEPGVANRERLTFIVDEPTDLQFYLVVRTIAKTPAATTIGAGGAPVFWFPPKKAASGDRVVLFTGFGTNSSVQADASNSVHFFYWGLPQTAFETPGFAATLIEAASWETRARF